MEDYKFKEKSEVMFNHKRVYCLHKFGHCFLANKFLKILVLPTCSFDYIAMIRPLHNI